MRSEICGYIQQNQLPQEKILIRLFIIASFELGTNIRKNGVNIKKYPCDYKQKRDKKLDNKLQI